MAEYDSGNIFAKIIDGDVPSFKVWESKASLAVLDAFPMVEGHTLMMPKTKGATSLLTMKPRDATTFMGDVQRVAKAVQEATGCDAVNIWSNCGEASGQTVFHPHVHIVPRKNGDNLMKYPPSAKEAVAKEAAEPLVAKIQAALNPPKPLRKAKWGEVKKVNPSSKGLNLKMKLLEEPKEVESTKGKFYEALAGDSTGTVVVSIHENQKEGLKNGATITIQNGSTRMIKGHIRVLVDKWGKLEATSDEFEGEVDQSKENNKSATEYELVKG